MLVCLFLSLCAVFAILWFELIMLIYTDSDDYYGMEQKQKQNENC